MTKLIAVAILIAVLFGGYQLFFYWERVKNEEETQKKQTAAAMVQGDSLPGMPVAAQYQFEATLRTAEGKGLAALRDWLKTYGKSVADPRKAWVELDYCQFLSKEDPAEARRLFAEVKKRTPETSPVWPRIKQLEKTYE